MIQHILPAPSPTEEKSKKQMLNSPYPPSIRHSCWSNSPGESSLARLEFLWFSDLIYPIYLRFKKDLWHQSEHIHYMEEENAGQWVTWTARNRCRSRTQSSWFPATFSWWHILQGKNLHNLLSFDYRECYHFNIKQCTEYAQIRIANSLQGYSRVYLTGFFLGWWGHNVSIMAA